VKTTSKRQNEIGARYLKDELRDYRSSPERTLILIVEVIGRGRSNSRHGHDYKSKKKRYRDYNLCLRVSPSPNLDVDDSTLAQIERLEWPGIQYGFMDDVGRWHFKRFREYRPYGPLDRIIVDLEYYFEKQGESFAWNVWVSADYDITEERLAAVTAEALLKFIRSHYDVLSPPQQPQ
jgi:hypothetical protein